MADQKQLRMAWKNPGKFPGVKTAGKTSRMYEVLEDPPPHQPSPHGSASAAPLKACLPNRQGRVVDGQGTGQPTNVP